jgi:ketosteroid isomerase-like protein
MKNIVLIVLLTLLFSCVKKIDLQYEKYSLLKVDSLFSAISESKGMKDAYSMYLDEKGVMLRPNSMPIIGQDRIFKYHDEIKSNTAILTWIPTFAEVSEKGDLGYTYGLFKLKTADTLFFGTYVTIWKKNTKGQWKVVMDTGNSGIGN